MNKKKAVAFAKGNVVRVVKDTAGHGWPKNKNHIIESVNSGRTPALQKIWLKTHSTFAYAQDLELVEEAKATPVPAVKKVRVLTEDSKELLKFITDAFIAEYGDTEDAKSIFESAFKRGNYNVEVETGSISFKERR